MRAGPMSRSSKGDTAGPRRANRVSWWDTNRLAGSSIRDRLRTSRRVFLLSASSCAVLVRADRKWLAGHIKQTERPENLAKVLERKTGRHQAVYARSFDERG